MSGLLEQDTAEPVGGSEAEKRRALWLETGAVLFVLAFPLVGWVVCLAGWGTGYVEHCSRESTLHCLDSANYYMSRVEAIFTSPMLVPLVLFLVWRNGEPWARLGLVRPRPEKEMLIGLGLVLVAGIVDETTIATVRPSYVWTWSNLFPASVSLPDGILLGVTSCVVGFSEELLCRGYLIPRFETLLGSMWKSILLSAAIFGACHLPTSPVTAVSTCLVGILLGMTFCATRRIWPVAIAHSLWNFVVATHTNAALQ